MAGTKVRRLAFLDAIRGVAALCVLLHHVFSDATPALRAVTVNWFNLGDFGVYTFFLVSGFIIPVSLERHPTATSFWRSRFWRLYPPFWFSLAAVVILGALGAIELDPAFFTHPLRNISANASMLAYFVHVPQALGVYWTLSIELLFYALCTILKLTHLINRRVLVTCLSVVLYLLSALACLTPHFDARHFQSTLGGLLLTALLGSVAYETYAEGKNSTSLIILTPVVLATIVTGIWLRYGLHPATDSIYLGFSAQAYSWMLAFVFFFLMYSLRAATFGAPFLWLGRVSYSLYLMHGIVITLLQATHLSRTLYSVLAISLSLLTAELCYRFIEKPFSVLASQNKRRSLMFALNP